MSGFEIPDEFRFEVDRAAASLPEEDGIEWGLMANGGVKVYPSREAAVIAVREWNKRAAGLRLEANGHASYPGAYLQRRRAATNAGPWEDDNDA